MFQKIEKSEIIRQCGTNYRVDDVPENADVFVLQEKSVTTALRFVIPSELPLFRGERPLIPAKLLEDTDGMLQGAMDVAFGATGLHYMIGHAEKGRDAAGKEVVYFWPAHYLTRVLCDPQKAQPAVEISGSVEGGRNFRPENLSNWYATRPADQIAIFADYDSSLQSQIQPVTDNQLRARFVPKFILRGSNDTGMSRVVSIYPTDDCNVCQAMARSSLERLMGVVAASYQMVAPSRGKRSKAAVKLGQHHAG